MFDDRRQPTWWWSRRSRPSSRTRSPSSLSSPVMVSPGWFVQLKTWVQIGDIKPSKISKGNPQGTMEFSHETSGFDKKYPLNQSIDVGVTHGYPDLPGYPWGAPGRTPSCDRGRVSFAAVDYLPRWSGRGWVWGFGNHRLNISWVHRAKLC
jgi:hypothetical protein